MRLGQLREVVVQFKELPTVKKGEHVSLKSHFCNSRRIIYAVGISHSTSAGPKHKFYILPWRDLVEEEHSGWDTGVELVLVASS